MMKRDRRYSTYEGEDMILRDCLAADRTILANERTYLAYLRTAVSLLAAGIGLIKYVDDDGIIGFLGYILTAASAATFILGTRRFLDTRHPLKKLFKGKE